MAQRSPTTGARSDLFPASIWKSVVDHIPVGAALALRDLEGRILYVNREFTALTGYDMSDIPTVSDWIRLACPDAGYRRMVLNNWPRDVDLEPIDPGSTDPHPTGRDVSCDVFCKDGAKKRLLLRVGQLGDDYVIVTALDVTRIVMHDVSETNAADRELLGCETRLQQVQRLESLGQLAGGVAHAFNNMLMGILGSVSLAAAMEVDGSIRSQLDRIESSARQAAELAAQMLACSRKVNADLNDVELQPLLQEMKPLLRALTRDRVRLEIETNRDTHTARASSTQVRQVLLNLVSNAAEAVLSNPGDSEEGAITIRLLRHTQKETVSSDGIHLAPGSYVVLEVADNGPGMSNETLSRVFDPFFTTKSAGRGLGLAAVHGIMRAHAGAVTADSEEGKGARFCIYLQAAATKAVGDSKFPGPTHKDRMRVLLIDDEAIVRDVATRMIEALGYEVLSAESGEEGLGMLRKDKRGIDMVIVDLNLPGMDGLEVRKQLMREFNKVRVVLSSGLGEMELSEQLDGLEFSGFLTKPFDLAALRSVIGQALQR